MAVAAHLQRKSQVARSCFYRLVHPVIAGFEHDQSFGSLGLGLPQQSLPPTSPGLRDHRVRGRGPDAPKAAVRL